MFKKRKASPETGTLSLDKLLGPGIKELFYQELKPYYEESARKAKLVVPGGNLDDEFFTRLREQTKGLATILRLEGYMPYHVEVSLEESRATRPILEITAYGRRWKKEERPCGDYTEFPSSYYQEALEKMRELGWVEGKRKAEMFVEMKEAQKKDEETKAAPWVCPICCGRGIVLPGFYVHNEDKCKSCRGTGIVWR